MSNTLPEVETPEQPVVATTAGPKTAAVAAEVTGETREAAGDVLVAPDVAEATEIREKLEEALAEASLNLQENGLSLDMLKDENVGTYRQIIAILSGARDFYNKAVQYGVDLTNLARNDILQIFASLDKQYNTREVFDENLDTFIKEGCRDYNTLLINLQNREDKAHRSKLCRCPQATLVGEDYERFRTKNIPNFTQLITENFDALPDLAVLREEAREEAGKDIDHEEYDTNLFEICVMLQYMPECAEKKPLQEKLDSIEPSAMWRFNLNKKK